jgi:L-seryl-tRNA(Ser) seleniumtransferase
LNTFSREAETIVSRGELVEIGGDFRVPDVSQSGVRTSKSDHEPHSFSGLSQRDHEHTRMIMRVHTELSHHRFYENALAGRVKRSGTDAGLLLYEDAGSGALFDGEPIIKQSLKDGADIVSFSGDKLLGGPQAGLIVGRAELIERMRRNPLYRALRADKLRLVALEVTLEEYSRGLMPPTIEMLAMPLDQIARRADEFVRKIKEQSLGTITVEAIKSESAVGGGSAPTSSLATIAIAVAGESLTPNQIADNLRQWNPPIIARIAEDRVLIDLRTVARTEEIEIEKALCSLATSQTT